MEPTGRRGASGRKRGGGSASGSNRRPAGSYSRSSGAAMGPDRGPDSVGCCRVSGLDGRPRSEIASGSDAASPDCVRRLVQARPWLRERLVDHCRVLREQTRVAPSVHLRLAQRTSFSSYIVVLRGFGRPGLPSPRSSPIRCTARIRVRSVSAMSSPTFLSRCRCPHDDRQPLEGHREFLPALRADPPGGEVVRRVVQRPLRLPQQHRQLRTGDAELTGGSRRPRSGSRHRGADFGPSNSASAWPNSDR